MVLATRPFKRVVIWMALALILFSTILPLYTSTASAVANPGLYAGAEGDPAKQLEMYKYAYRMGRCLEEGGLHQGNDKLAGGNIFQTGDIPSVVSSDADATALNKTLGDRVSCGDGNNILAKHFFGLFSIADPISEFLCRMGWYRETATERNFNSCISLADSKLIAPDETNTTNRYTVFRDFMITYYGLDVGSPGLFITFDYYDEIVMNLCLVSNKDKPGANFSGIPTNKQYVLSNLKDGELISQRYIGDENTDKTIIETSYFTYKCNSSTDNFNLTTLRNNALKAYYDDLYSKAEEWCTSDSGGRQSLKSAAIIKACTLGVLNSNTSGYCDSKYVSYEPNVPVSIVIERTGDALKQYNACVLGAAGDANIILQSSTQNSNTPPGEDGASSSCAVDGVGWILCPVLNTMASITDSMFGVLARNLLSTNTSLVSSDGDIYIAWGSMRNIANVAFVLAFLLIIFSQITNIGLDNYGIKKMLPRLVVAAILVNVSFYICQIAVDLSNILGYSLKGLFDSIGANITEQASQIPGAAVSGVNGVGGFDVWKSLTAVALVGVGGAVIWSSLGALVSILLVSLIAVLTIFLLMILRQMLIILLVVISPIAFVAFILPNTQTLFKKWQKLFTSLLMLFPIVSVVFGASSLASAVLTNVYAGSTDSIGQIIAAGVLMVPLIIVPSLLKASLDGVGKLGSMINGAGSKIGGALGKKGSEAFGNSRLAQYQEFKKGLNSTSRLKVQAGNYAGKNIFKKMQSGANKKLNTRVLPKLGNGMKGFAGKSTAAGDAAEDAEDSEAMKGAHSSVTSLYADKDHKVPLSTKQLIQLAAGKDVTDTGEDDGSVIHRGADFDDYQRRAAIEVATSRANSPELNRLLDATGSMSTLGRKSFVAALGQRSDAGTLLPSIGGTLKAEILNGAVTSDYAMLEAVPKGKYSIDALTKMEATGIEALAKSIEFADSDSKELHDKKEAAQKILSASYAELANADPTIKNRVVTGGAVELALRGLAFGGPIVNVSAPASGAQPPQQTSSPPSPNPTQQAGPPPSAPEFPGASTTQQSPGGIFVVEHFKPKEPTAGTSGSSDETK